MDHETEIGFREQKTNRRNRRCFGVFAFTALRRDKSVSAACQPQPGYFIAKCPL
jgi:hypothetical protein